ncbi:hypothetical protein BDZ89DRAFT_403251 [Hymenopellis radicata]|nr:hypothetical protein BDZ89DRAFT_403251 [Hymenopellis radicata]
MIKVVVAAVARNVNIEAPRRRTRGAWRSRTARYLPFGNGGRTLPQPLARTAMFFRAFSHCFLGDPRFIFHLLSTFHTLSRSLGLLLLAFISLLVDISNIYSSLVYCSSLSSMKLSAKTHFSPAGKALNRG